MSDTIRSGLAEQAGTRPASRGSLAIELMPVVFVLLYIGGTIWLFFAGPIPWPVDNGSILFIYLMLALTLILIGFVAGSAGTARPAPLRRWKTLFAAGAVASCVILFPSAYVYTGKMPWQIMEALRDQNQVYRDMLTRLVETDGTRGPIALARALAYPLIFAVIPLGVLHWTKLNWLFRGLFLASIISSVMFSILRGTDRETFDAIIILGAAGLIAVGRYCVGAGIPLARFLTSARMLAAIAACAVFAVLAFNLFVDRKAARYEGDISGVCVGVEEICADRYHPLMQSLGERNRFALAMLSGYVAQGYYGVSLAMDLDFQSTWGFGHSPLAARIYEILTGDESLYQRSFSFRLVDYGWSDEYQWSTLLTWLANDVGYGGAAILVGFFAFLWGKVWKDAVFARNDAAAIVFCFLIQLFVYFPANNQIMQTLDGYFALIVWMGYWLWSRRRRSVPA